MVRTIILLIMILINYIVIELIPIKNKKNVLLNVSFLELFLILLFRAPFSDMINYINMFDYIGNLPFGALKNIEWEYGYVLLNKLISMITLNERVLIGIVAFITLLGQYIFIKKYSKNYLVTLVLFIGLNFFNYHYILFRQEIALAIVLFSIRYIEKQKLVKFILCIIIAMLFHQSALVFVLIYIVSKIESTKEIRIYFIPVFMIIFTLRGFLGNLIYISSYTEYVGNTQTSDGYTMLFLLMGIYIAILVLEYIFFNKEKNKISKTENIFYWMYTLAIIFQILATTQSLVARIVLYFSLSLIILLPNIIEKIENKKLVVLINFILVVLIMVFSFTNEPLEPYKLYFK